MRRSLHILFVSVVILFLPFTPLRAQPTPTNLGPHILKILREHRVPGAGVALISRDSVRWIGTLGRADYDQRVPVTDSTLFGVGSIAKTFLSLATLIAQEQGLVDIHDPIRRRIPSLAVGNRWHATDPVRLIHLLEHTSGFDEAHYDLFHQADASTPFREVMEYCRRSLTTRWPPGRYYAYNNLGAAVAAYGLETAVGEPFEAFVKKNVLLPLYMKHATYHPTTGTAPLLAHGYSGAEYRVELFPSLPQWPAGSLVASVSDMANLVSLLLHRGQFQQQSIVSSSSVRRMETPETSLRAVSGVRYGYGKGLRTTREDSHLFYGHGGSYGGFLSEFGYSPALGQGYVILLNNRDGRKALKAIKQQLLTHLLPNETAPPGSSSPPLTNEPPASIAGGYQPVTTDTEISRFLMHLVDLQFVVREDGRWYQQSVLGDRQELLPVGDNRFRRAGEPVATSVFVRDKNGDWLWLDEVTYRRIPAWQGYATFAGAVISVLTLGLSFVTLLIRLLVTLMSRRRKPRWVTILPLTAVSCFVGMVVSLLLGYDPLVKYSVGAVLFLIFGGLFFVLSFVGLFLVLRTVYQQESGPTKLTYVALIACLSGATVATYLLYWDIIGLTLWDY